MTGRFRPKIPLPPSEGKAAEPFEIEIIAPAGFRPSDWAERLMDFDDAAELGQDLLYLGYEKGGRVLVMRAELLDLANPQYELRCRVCGGILSFAKENGHEVRIHAELAEVSPVLHQAVLAALKTRELPYSIKAR